MTSRRFSEGLGWWVKTALGGVAIVVLVSLGIMFNALFSGVAPEPEIEAQEVSFNPDKAFLEALEAADSADYPTAYTGFWELADAHNHIEAQFLLGALYEINPEALELDPMGKLYWWQTAARNGHAMAQFNLGVMNEQGEGVSLNPGQAYAWYFAVLEDDGQWSADRVLREMATSNLDHLRQRMDAAARTVAEEYAARHFQEIQEQRTTRNSS